MNGHTPELKEAVETWGEDDQLTMVIEECSELIKEICKWKRKKAMPEDLYDEIADVQIMLEQLNYICAHHDSQAQEKIRARHDYKIRRLGERLQAWHQAHGRTNTH